MRSNKALVLGTTLLASSMLLVGAANAQAAGTTQSSADENEQAEEQAAQVDEVVVVGSRIRRDTYNSPSPIQVVTRDETILSGYNSTTEALQGTAVTGGTAQINNAYGGFVVNGGPGANTISLRGLGATRTLVLLNGRRVSPAGSRGSVGSADLNVLPSSMIERIEVLRDGASSIYGSDAVAGVINIITRNDIDQPVVEAQFNAPTEANGAGQQTRFSIASGLVTDRLSLSGSLEFYNRDEVTLGDREFTRCNTDYRLNVTTGQFSDYIDPLTGQPKCYPITSTGSNGVTINTIGTNTTAGVGATGAVGTSFNRWRPNSAVTTGLVGFEGVGNASTNLNVRDTFDPRTLNRSLISPVEVATAFLKGDYDVGAFGNGEAYFEFLANRRDSSQTGYRQLSLDYNKGSLLIPGNLAFSTFSNPTVTSSGNQVGVRAFIGFGNDKSSQTVDFTKFITGMRGDFIIPQWRYDAYVSYSRSDSEYTSVSFLTVLLSYSLDVVAAPSSIDSSLTRQGTLTNGTTGTVTCRINITDPTARCIPAPFLTSQTIGGTLPQNWVNYVFRPVTGRTVYDETVFAVGLDGPVFQLPAGDISVFVGAEWREASIDDTPSLDSQRNNLYNLTSSAITRGSDSVYEIFGEIEAPILANLPFAQQLTFNGSLRYTDYQSYGADTTYKLGLLYTPVDFLSFRATYGTSYRAPALFEQFQGGTSGFINSTNDPCNNWDASGVNPNRRANCESQGLPAGFTATSSVTVITQGGADQDLKAETSDNLTIGIVLEPSLPSKFGRLSFSTDYYEIEVNNGVDRVGSSFILSSCYDSPTADFAADAGYCAFIDDRNPSSNALTVRDSYTNIATDIVKGLDYNLRYSRDIASGEILANFYLTQYTEISSKLFETDPYLDVKGFINNPEFAGSGDISYIHGDWRVRYGFEWIDAMSSDEYYNTGPGSANPDYTFSVDDYWLHHLSFQWRPQDFGVTVGVRNILDEDLPQISSGVYNRVGNTPLYSGYDYVGRTLFINVTKSF